MKPFEEQLNAVIVDTYRSIFEGGRDDFKALG